jgi:hypothetical protein
VTASLGRSIPLTVAWVGVIESTGIVAGGGDADADAEDDDRSAVAAEEGAVAGEAAATRVSIFVRVVSMKSSNG